ncbi:MAG: myxococcus cysteine-rich repeat containing protein [Candidatus Gracilibacteria bacterium]|nr:myxococcus cysteine-rich repeat containing protein [Candidatus Gracilibacteria bacterium]
MSLKGILSTALGSVALFFLSGVFIISSFASSSTSYQLDGQLQDVNDSVSTNYSLCSRLPYATSSGSSTSYQLMPKLDCALQAAVATPPPGGGGRPRFRCGNSILELTEQCDDGNRDDGDGCSFYCRLEYCGDGIVQSGIGEQCDDANSNDGDGCSSQCVIESIVSGTTGGSGGTGGTSGTGGSGSTSGGSGSGTATGTGGTGTSAVLPLRPSAPVCGNGILEAGEQCDDGNSLSGDSCSTLCSIEDSNGLPVEPENPEDPEAVENPEEPENSEDPQNEESDLDDEILQSVCGNGQKESGEECDDGNLTNGDSCSNICRLEIQLADIPLATILPPPTIQVPGRTPVVPYVPPAFPGDALIGSEYLTNDITTLFYERFEGGSGDYDIYVFDRDKQYDVTVKEISDGYFAFQSDEDFEDGYYVVDVIDKQDRSKFRRLLLEVRKQERIESPELLTLDRQDIEGEELDMIDLGSLSETPVITGRTPLNATVAMYSTLLDEVFIVYTDESREFELVYPRALPAGETEVLHFVAHYENGHVSREQKITFTVLGGLKGAALEDQRDPFNALFWAFITTVSLIVLSAGFMSFAFTRLGVSASSSLVFGGFVRKAMKWFIASLVMAALLAFYIIDAFALTTTPNLIPYEGVLKDAGGVAVIVSQDIRFSFWLDADFTDVVDRDGAGAIPVAAPGNSGFTEVHTVVPDSTGFFQVDIGSIGGTIPDFITTSHLFLQVEVKPTGSPDTSYETLDIDGVDNAIDRQALGTMPYSRNSDFIDNRELGENSGDIAILGVGDVFPTQFIPGGTDVDNFIIDADDDAPGNIQLSFGAIINNQILEWDPNGVAAADGWFNFTDDVNIGGDLSITGTVNGVTIGPKNKTLQLQAEYPNAVVNQDGTDNRGKLEGFFIDTDGAAAPDNFNYYQWTTQRATLQDLDLIVRVRLPDDFTAFQAVPMVLRYRTSDGVIANNRVDLSVDDTTGTTVAGITGNAALASPTFTTTDITLPGGTFTAGEEITIIIKLTSLTGAFAQVADLDIHYVGQ